MYYNITNKAGKLTGKEITLTPAYGRDYKNADDVLKDFYDGKDFTLNHYSGKTTYCSIRDFVPDAIVTFRYDNSQKTMNIINIENNRPKTSA